MAQHNLNKAAEEDLMEMTNFNVGRIRCERGCISNRSGASPGGPALMATGQRGTLIFTGKDKIMPRHDLRGTGRT
jgi:hypothetical protein